MCTGGLCLLALAGCAAGPDYRKPEFNLPAAWRGLTGASAAPGETALTARPAELVSWWKNFDDPLLSSLVERALLSNLDLRQAEARIRQARASEGIAAAALWPQVDANGSFTRSGQGETAFTESGPAAVSSGGVGNLFQAGLDAAWELDFFGGARRGVEAAQADLQAAREDRRDVLITLVSDVAVNYADLRQYQMQIEIAKKNLKAQRHTADITRKRYEAGFVGGLDVANAQAQAATTAAQIPVLETAARAAIYNIGVLLGREPAALSRELATEEPIPPTPPEIPLGLPSDLLRRRPDIRRAEAQLHAATARIGVATADLFPKFSLTGSFGFASTDVTQLANWSSRFYSFGPAVSWPIFDAGRIRWNIAVQNATQEEALLAYEKAILTALKDVETALISYTKELEHNKALSEAVANNRRAVELSRTLYVEGRTDFLNVLNAQRSLFVSEDALAQSTNALTTDLIALYKALGGGWEDTEGESQQARNGGERAESID